MPTAGRLHNLRKFASRSIIRPSHHLRADCFFICYIENNKIFFKKITLLQSRCCNRGIYTNRCIIISQLVIIKTAELLIWTVLEMPFEVASWYRGTNPAVGRFYNIIHLFHTRESRFGEPSRRRRHPPSSPFTDANAGKSRFVSYGKLFFSLVSLIIVILITISDSVATDFRKKKKTNRKHRFSLHFSGSSRGDGDFSRNKKISVDYFLKLFHEQFNRVSPVLYVVQSYTLIIII